ncbi:MAG: hypothetical protein M3Y91_17790, partial [Actinomycetota bacterium]|nr:hypothetical protein [Actinomycetota bacterium]
MAKLVIGSDEVTLVLRPFEHALSFHKDLHLPLTAIVRVSVPTSSWLALRGWRSTGLGIPGYAALGVRRHGTGWDFAAVFKQQRAVLIELNTGRYEQVLVSVPDPPATATAVA